MNKHRLSTTPTREELSALAIGDIVHLDGLIYTAREGVYKRALEEGEALPANLPADSAANFRSRARFERSERRVWCCAPKL